MERLSAIVFAFLAVSCLGQQSYTNYADLLDWRIDNLQLLNVVARTCECLEEPCLFLVKTDGRNYAEKREACHSLTNETGVCLFNNKEALENKLEDLWTKSGDVNQKFVLLGGAWCPPTFGRARPDRAGKSFWTSTGVNLPSWMNSIPGQNTSDVPCKYLAVKKDNSKFEYSFVNDSSSDDLVLCAKGYYEQDCDEGETETTTIEATTNEATTLETTLSTDYTSRDTEGTATAATSSHTESEGYTTTETAGTAPETTRTASTEKTTTTTAARARSCKEKTYDGVTFPSVGPGNTSFVDCPKGFTGRMSWKCTGHAEPYFTPKKPTFNCTPEWLEDLMNKVNDTDLDFVDFVDQLQNDTQSQSLDFGSNIKDVLNLLEVVNSRFFTEGGQLDPAQVRQFSEGVLTITSNVLKSDNAVGWRRIDKKEDFKKSFGAVLHVVDSLGEKLLCQKSNSSNPEIDTENLVFHMLSLYEDTDTVFKPINKDNTSWNNQIVFPPQANRLTDNCSSKAVGVLYKSLDGVLGNITFNEDNDHDKEQVFLNTPVIAFSLSSGAKNDTSLSSPITMVLRKNVYSTSKHVCVYWNFTRNDWSNDGCRLSDKSNDTHVVCECSHLTNFAVLMTINTKVPKLLGLEIVSIICCSCSMLGLIATIACLAGIKSLRCRRNVITCNLCLSLLLVNFFILVGLSRTENTIVCRVMAMLLHYFLLSAFVWMLLEGYLLYQVIVVVFTKMSNIPIAIFYAAGYGLPFVTVAVAAAVRFDHYSQPEYCWLSFANGMIWSFIGPLCVLVLVNTVIFIIVIKTAYNARTKKFDRSASSTQTNWLKGSFSTMCLLGTTWILAFAYLDNKAVFVTYIFSILNGFQGFFIFFFHVILNEKNRETVLKTLQGHYKRHSWSRDTSSMRTQRTNRTSVRSDLSAHRTEVRQDTQVSL